MYIFKEDYAVYNQTETDQGSPAEQSERNHVVDLYKQALIELQRSQMRARYKKQQANQLYNSLLALLEEVFSHENELEHFFTFKEANPDHSYRTHALHTAILAASIAKWLELDNYSIIEIAITGSLHDIGQVEIPDTILKKKKALTPDEWQIIQKHPRTGAGLLLTTSWITPQILSGILKHHERLDGSGYPEGCSDDAIPLYSRIVAVAGAYDNATSNHPYKKANTIFEAAANLRDLSYGQLDQHITQKLYDHILAFFSGKTAVLSNGEHGTIVQLGAEPQRTLIKTEKEFYDLTHKSAPYVIKVR
ncbi:MAG: HD domain-containing phosphohydrolase [Bacillota bacterium]|nr:HD domain-containing phosphohydrolase [Bacillota bacterium]